MNKLHIFTLTQLIQILNQQPCQLILKSIIPDHESLYQIDYALHTIPLSLRILLLRGTPKLLIQSDG